MVYTDKCPVLSDTQWRDNSRFPVIHKGETPSDWIKRIWDQLMNYRNNNKLTDDKKRYLIARKMEYLWEGDLGHSVEVNIAICYNCDIIHILFYRHKQIDHSYKMEEHWRTNCTGNRHCDISFKEYTELKQKLKTERDIYTRLAIYRYELLIEILSIELNISEKR